MADSYAATTVTAHGHPPGTTKRDFIKLLGASGAAIGVGAIAWPFIDYMNPSRDVLALSATEVDLTPIPEGMGITVVWRGKPIFVRHLTAKEFTEAKDAPMSALIEPVPAADRVKSGHDQWIIVIGICTHLGCIPLGNKPTDPRGEWGGWFCPCHGSQYDTVGRVRHGPAPANLYLPPYAFETDTKIKIG
jgi:ubiquinol-cytochrome c reductase iron-sulfur subunit